MSEGQTYARVGVAGSGTIACELAACASTRNDTLLLARSAESAARAPERVAAACGKLEGADSGRVRVVTAAAGLARCELVVEAIAESLAAKGELLEQLGRACPDADLATTTSSLSVSQLAMRSGRRDRFFGLHVFNPVTRMELVELCFPVGVAEEARARARAWCAELGKRAVEVPDQPGFVVNRLLFPYLFDAVRFMERTGMAPEKIDSCMSLGAGHPMGPLRLLDFVGIDVAVAIGHELHAGSDDAAHLPPARLVAMAQQGRLGRKSGAGFYEYDD